MRTDNPQWRSARPISALQAVALAQQEATQQQQDNIISVHRWYYSLSAIDNTE